MSAVCSFGSKFWSTSISFKLEGSWRLCAALVVNILNAVQTLAKEWPWSGVFVLDY